MVPVTISFRLVPKVKPGRRRAVGILEGSPDLCAVKLLGLPDEDAKYNWFSMESWVNLNNGPTSRFHRFDGTDYFVFKQVAKQHRFYGFLCNPLPNTDARFQLCVLTTYAQKKENATDQAELNRVQQWMDSPATKAAIKKSYPDVKEDQKK